MNQQIFLESINKEIVFDVEFYKKVYGYSMYNKAFPLEVVNKLVKIGRKDIINEYNKWLSLYLSEEEKISKAVAIWYVKEFNKQYDNFIRNNNFLRNNNCNEVVNEDWSMRKRALLLEKKKILLQANLMLLTEN